MFYKGIFSSQLIFLAIFSVWDMVDFVLKIRSESVWEKNLKKIMLGKLRPWTPRNKTKN